MPTTFDVDSQRFNFRVAAVVLRGDEVLLHQAEGDDFWTLPGGRPELGEPAARALVRELREELTVEAEVGRFLWIVEGFFDHEDKRWHELLLVFLCRLPTESSPMTAVKRFQGAEGGRPLWFDWLKPADLVQRTIYPPFLAAGLQSLPTTTQHIVDESQRLV